MPPRGYLHQLDDGHCLVGLESIPQSANHFRLGSVFLKNFYVGLDFDQNQILLGPNQLGAVTHITKDE